MFAHRLLGSLLSGNIWEVTFLWYLFVHIHSLKWRFCASKCICFSFLCCIKATLRLLANTSGIVALIKRLFQWPSWVTQQLHDACSFSTFLSPSLPKGRGAPLPFCVFSVSLLAHHVLSMSRCTLVIGADLIRLASSNWFWLCNLVDRSLVEFLLHDLFGNFGHY